MKKRFYLSLILASLLAAPAAFAAPGEGGEGGPSAERRGPGGPGGPGGRRGGPPQFSEIDADGDGMATKEEFIAHAVQQAKQRAERIFSMLDKDGDGQIAESDIPQRGMGMRRGPGGEGGQRKPGGQSGAAGEAVTPKRPASE